jgi:hypothetical protein
MNFDLQNDGELSLGLFFGSFGKVCIFTFVLIFEVTVEIEYSLVLSLIVELK